MPKISYLKINRTLLFIAVCINFLFITTANAQYEGYTRSERKLQYKVIESKNDSRRAKIGEYVTVRIKARIGSAKLLFTSDTKTNKEERIKVEPHSFKGDYKEIFTLIGVGDSAQVKIPVNFFYPRILGKNKPKEISSKEFVMMEFRMLAIQTAQEIQEERKQKAEQAKISEKQKIDQFLKQQGWTDSPTESGIYFKILQKGSGVSPKPGNSVTIRYKGYLTNGKIFDATKKGEEPFRFTLGNNEVIDAWEEIIKTMQSGMKLVILTPSSMAYGAIGFPGTIVEPYEPLIFEIELLKFND